MSTKLKLAAKLALKYRTRWNAGQANQSLNRARQKRLAGWLYISHENAAHLTNMHIVHIVCQCASNTIPQRPPAI